MNTNTTTTTNRYSELSKVATLVQKNGLIESNKIVTAKEVLEKIPEQAKYHESQNRNASSIDKSLLYQSYGL